MISYDGASRREPLNYIAKLLLNFYDCFSMVFLENLIKLIRKKFLGTVKTEKCSTRMSGKKGTLTNCEWKLFYALLVNRDCLLGQHIHDSNRAIS